ncbi:MAG: hypothetical protein K0R72_1181 [Clostridia bacterium]|jgi:hypothetical protein|nr:hypothetical protein [Clostridia bacterium]
MRDSLDYSIFNLHNYTVSIEKQYLCGIIYILLLITYLKF